MSSLVTVNCRNCGREFQVAPSRLKHGRGLDCSLECSYASRARQASTKVQKQCERCGKVFEVVPSKADRSRYCSRECKNPPAVSMCLHCGQTFRHHPSDGGMFCSKGCADASEYKAQLSKTNAGRQWANPDTRQRLMDGIATRSESEDWRSAPHFQKGEDHPRYKGNKRARQGASQYKYKKWRRDVFRRDNYTCQKCGERGGLPCCPPRQALVQVSASAIQR